MFVLILASSSAEAQEPTVVVEGSTVRGSAYLDVPPQSFLTELRDPGWESKISGSGTRAKLEAEEGGCQHVSYVSPNAVMEAVYEVKRCPTTDGWSSTLVSSNAFSTYRASWRAVPEGEGSRVTYEIDLTTSLWVPAGMVRGEIKRSVLKMMTSMADWAKTRGP